jgi:Tfp pilus assembly protein PilO
MVILTAVGVLAVIVVLALVLVVPQFGRMSDLDNQIETADSQISEAEALLKTRQEAKEGASSTDAALLELAAAVPEQPDLPSLIIELQDVAYDSNVQLREIEPADLVQAEGYVTMPLSITVWGDWADNVDFVQSLQELTRQVRVVEAGSEPIDEADTERATESLDTYSVETNMLLEFYIIPADSGQAGSVDQGAAPAPAQ